MESACCNIAWSSFLLQPLALKSCFSVYDRGGDGVTSAGWGATRRLRLRRAELGVRAPLGRPRGPDARQKGRRGEASRRELARCWGDEEGATWLGDRDQGRGRSERGVLGGGNRRRIPKRDRKVWSDVGERSFRNPARWHPGLLASHRTGPVVTGREAP